MKEMFVAVDTDELIQRVVVLAGQIWREHYPPIIGEKQVDYMLNEFQNAEVIRGQVDAGMKYYLVTKENEYVGYFAVREDDNVIFLSKLYIKASASGCGLGEQVLEFIRDFWKPESVKLTVNKQNSKSIHFYENRGFIKVGEVVEDIGCGFVMDDYRMEWFC